MYECNEHGYVEQGNQIFEPTCANAPEMFSRISSFTVLDAAVSDTNGIVSKFYKPLNVLGTKNDGVA